MKKFMPDTYNHLMMIKESIGTPEQEMVLDKEFHAMESQSIDYGIMEKAEDIYILPGTFGWMMWAPGWQWSGSKRQMSLEMW